MDPPQVVGMLPDRLLLCRASVARLTKQSVAPQADGKVPLTLLFCTNSSVSDCMTQAWNSQPPCASQQSAYTSRNTDSFTSSTNQLFVYSMAHSIYQAISQFCPCLLTGNEKMTGTQSCRRASHGVSYNMWPADMAHMLPLRK